MISVLYWAHLCIKCSLGFSNFLEEISSLSHSIVFLYFFALITEEGFLISPWYSLELCIQMGISFLFSFAFCFASFHSYLWGLLRQSFCFFAFLFMEMVLIPVSCTMSWTSIHSSSGTLSDLIHWIYLPLLLYNCKGFDLGYTWRVGESSQVRSWDLRQLERDKINVLFFFFFPNFILFLNFT